MARQCQANVVCWLCQKGHPTCFHIRYQESKAVISRKTRANGMVRGAMTTVVPVYVSNGDREILTYTLLDTQSDATFIADTLAKSLEPNGTEIQLTMSTMTNARQHSMATKYSNVSVRGINESNEIRINHAYSRRFIPARTDHIPTKRRIEAWIDNEATE